MEKIMKIIDKKWKEGMSNDQFVLEIKINLKLQFRF